jgi:2'-5' RNA ligase
MRLFIAIELPQEIKKILWRLRSDIPGARWVAQEQLHLTLSFLGELEEAEIQRLTGVLSGIRAQGFELRFGGTGCFPNTRQPRVLWVGLEPEPLLNRLAALVRKAVLSCDIPQEERPFSAHITLARLKLPASHEVAAFLDQHQKHKLPTVRVGEFILFQSRLTPQGAIHAALMKFQLA